MNKPTFFHMAAKQHDVGDVVGGSGKRPMEFREPHVEVILERYRPKDRSDRGRSIYLRQTREFSTVGVTYNEGYIHMVEPIGRIEKRDLVWIGLLQRRHHRNTLLRKDSFPRLSDKDIAGKYWSGEASENPVWEWVAQKARVVDVDSKASRVRPDSALLNRLNRTD